MSPKIIQELWDRTGTIGQKNVLASLVARGGIASLDDVCIDLGTKPPTVRGLLSSITRNFQSLTGRADAKIIDYASIPGGATGYQISEPALSLLRNLIQPILDKTKFSLDWADSTARATPFAFVTSHPQPLWFEVWLGLNEWDAIAKLRNSGARESEDGRMLIFWFGSQYGEDFGVYLGIAPGADRVPAEKLVQAFRAPAISSTSDRLCDEDDPLNPTGWTHLWSRRFASEAELTNPDHQQIANQLDAAWKRFLAVDLPQIRAAISAVKLWRHQPSSLVAVFATALHSKRGGRKPPRGLSFNIGSAVHRAGRQRSRA